MNEFALRDIIASDLSVLEDGLTLVQKEKHLPNDLGTSGFIDILAKDIHNNFVLVEIKLNKSSERETFTELLKYVGLAKRHLGLKESEIRLFIVSPDWRELTVPFGEFVAAVNYNVTGFRVQMDGDVLVSILQEQPLEPGVGREILPRHWVQFYRREAERDQRSTEFATKIQERGILNFILVHIEMEHGYILYFAQQRETREFHEAVLKSHVPSRYEETMEVVADYEDEDALNEIADASTDCLYVRADEIEIGHPEKFKGWYENGSWKIQKILRFGVFSRDQRLTDEMIISELCGYGGQSHSWYFEIARPDDRSKRSEIAKKYTNSLYHNDAWRRTIRDALDWEAKYRNGMLAISIFNPENIIETIFLIDRTGNRSYLPKYTIVSDVSEDDSLHVIQGFVASSGSKALSWDEIVERHFSGDASNYHFMTHLHAIYEANDAIMADLGLKYASMHQRYGDGEREEGMDPVFRGREVRTTSGVAPVGLAEWMQMNPGLVASVRETFEQHVFFGPGMEPT